MRPALLCALLIAAFALRAQIFEKPYSADPDQPDWVREMYREGADIGAVHAAYRSFFEKNPFRKNSHTQYFKRWLRAYSRLPYAPGADAETVRLAQREQEDFARRSTELGILRGPTAVWTCVGPFDFDKEAASRSYAAGSAHFYTVEQSASAPGILYAGTATAGVWKSTDKGLSWVDVTPQLALGSVLALEIHPANPDVVLFGADGKLYQSLDGGQTWSINRSGLGTVTEIVLQPGNPQVVMIACETGFYRSVNAGATWNTLFTGPFQEIEFHPSDPNIVYAIRQVNAGTYFYRSTNGGASFVGIGGTGWPQPAAGEEQLRTEIATTPADPDRVYALCTGVANGGTGLYGIYVSYDQGLTWTFRCCGPGPGGQPSPTNLNLMGWDDAGQDDGGQYYYDLALDASDTNADSVMVGGVNLWISADAGATWNCPSKWSHSYKPNYVHADLHDIRYYGADIWVACDGGLFYSNNGGTTFDRRQLGIAGTDFWGFGMGAKDPGVMLGGAYHNGTMLKDNSTYLNGWLCTDGGDGIRGYVNPGKPRVAYSDYDKKFLPGDRNTPIPATGYDKKPNASYIIGESANMVFHPHNHHFFYSPVDSVLWKTEDDGASWTMVHNFGDGQRLAQMDVAWSDPDVLYVSTFPGWWEAKKIYRSDDAGQTWTEITPPNALLGGDTWVPYDLTVGDADPHHLWIARTSMYGDGYLNGRKVFRSTDGGATWTNVTTPALDNETPTNILFVRGSNEGVYLGTRRAVYYRSAGTGDWQLFNTGLPTNAVSIQLVADYRNGQLANGTSRSVWKADLFEDTPPKACISADRFTVHCTRDTVFFADRSALRVGPGTTWQWSFPGGVPATSNDENPRVVYAQPGTYDVSLTVTDAFGTSSQTLTDFLTVTAECEPDSVPGNALWLTTPDDWAVVPPFGTSFGSLTLSAWIKPDGNQASYAGLVFSSNNGATGLNFRDNNQLGYHWRDESGTWGWAGGPTVTPDEWHHVALVVTPTTATVYLDGVGYARNYTHQPVVLSAPFHLGNDRGYTNRTYRGLMDEVCFYDRALSQNEIRELMHLTRRPVEDPSLMAYYQFNRNAGTETDRAGVRHLSFHGAAARLLSTAPVGGGASARATVNGPGAVNFPGTGATLAFPPGGPFPDGELVVTRINLHPDQLPSPDSPARSYWVLNNFGTNATFAELASVQLDGWGPVSPTAAASPQDFELYQRGPRADGASWGSVQDLAEAATAGADGSVSFLQANGVDRPGQLMVMRHPGPVALEQPLARPLAQLVPNPARSGGFLSLHAQTGAPALVELFDASGRRVFEGTVLPHAPFVPGVLAPGVYAYRLEADGEVWNGRLVMVND
jgi:PKD repeat protein